MSLTPREFEIIALVKLGKCNREIACELKLAVGTVKCYLNKIFIKLRIESREQLILWSVK